MAIELVKEKYNNAINVVEIGRPGASSIKVGGETTLPFLFREGCMPNAPITALEILDSEPMDWPDALREPFGESIKDPVAWAKLAVEKFGSRLLCVRLQGAHPDYGNRSSAESVSTLKEIAKEARVPMVVIGCGDDDKDNDLLPKASQASKG